MVVPVGQGWRDAERMRIVLHNSRVFRSRFEKQGLDFVRGYVAGRHGWKPRWWIRFCDFIGNDAAHDPIYVARDMLEEAGIDPWTCRNSILEVQAQTIVDEQAG